MAPILHLRRVEGADLFEMYARSFERIWEASYAISPEEVAQKAGLHPAPAAPT
jgi:hypothetical protein